MRITEIAIQGTLDSSGQGTIWSSCIQGTMFFLFHSCALVCEELLNQNAIQANVKLKEA